jgi:hypothetical protein
LLRHRRTWAMSRRVLSGEAVSVAPPLGYFGGCSLMVNLVRGSSSK